MDGIANKEVVSAGTNQLQTAFTYKDAGNSEISHRFSFTIRTNGLFQRQKNYLCS